MKLAIFDLDGTLFSPAHRLHLAEQRQWGEFHRRHTGDVPYMGMLGLLGHLADGGFDIMFLTGRCESTRETTLKQIHDFRPAFVADNTEFLFMRPIGDNSPAAEYKAKVVRRFTDKNNVTEARVYDDVVANLIAIKDVLFDKNISYQAFVCKDGKADKRYAYAPLTAGIGTGGTGGISADELCNVFAKEAISEVPETARILRMMANTFEERNKVYGSNYERVAPIMKILFPDGLTPEILHSDQWHLFELIVVKLTRFAISGLQHKDSIHDTGVYAAMIGSILEKQNG